MAIPTELLGTVDSANYVWDIIEDVDVVLEQELRDDMWARAQEMVNNGHSLNDAFDAALVEAGILTSQPDAAAPIMNFVHLTDGDDEEDEFAGPEDVAGNSEEANFVSFLPDDLVEDASQSTKVHKLGKFVAEV